MRLRAPAYPNRKAANRAYSRAERALDRRWHEPPCDQDGVACQPIIYRHLKTALEVAKVRPGEDVFVDYSCGRGRGLLYAAHYPFRRVIGVEPLASLARDARRNAAHASRRDALRCADVVIEEADAGRYRLPADATVLWLFRPFGAQTLARVLAEVCRSIREAPRPLRLVHVRPRGAADLEMGAPWLRLAEELPTGLWTDLRFSLYCSERYER